MYKPCWMSVPLIVMLTACGGGSDDSNPNPTPDPKEKKALSFIGNVYDGPIADATVSVYAGNRLLASGKTNADGKYLINASIDKSVYEKIKNQPITYRALRDDIILYQYDGKSLEEAFKKQKNSALISNFSTVEYVLADVNKDNFVSTNEWKNYQSLDRNELEPQIIRYGVGLKAIIDYSASMAGFKNSTIWLRAVLDNMSWNEWLKLNNRAYTTAWSTLFSDKWFLENEAHRFNDINSWKEEYNNVVKPDLDPVLNNIVLSGLPQRASVGDLFSPSIYGTLSNGVSLDITDSTNIYVYPAGAIVIDGHKWRIKQSGRIVIKAEYKGYEANSEIIASEDAALENIVLTGIGSRVTVGDQLNPVVSALWTDSTTTEVTPLVSWSSIPADAVKVVDGKLQVMQMGDITLTSTYQGATATVKFNADKAVLTSLRIGYNHREQYLQDHFTAVAEGVHHNNYIVDFSDEAEWTSSNPEIIESLGNGQFVSKAKGTATITAKLGELTASQEFDIVAKLMNISLNLPNNSIGKEQKLQLSLNGEYNDGTVSVITEDITWTSSNPAILTIDENGVATGITTGEVVVTANHKDKVLTETVSVIEAIIVSSNPEFKDGVIQLTEGGSYPYSLKFTRSNGLEHVFSVENGDYNIFEFGDHQDESYLNRGEIDKRNNVLRAVREGKTRLVLSSPSKELQDILVEVGAISSGGSSSAEIKVMVNSNDDVYQWHKIPLNEGILALQEEIGSLHLVQVMKEGDTVYRFWQKDDSNVAPIFYTKITSEGESAPVELDVPGELHKVIPHYMHSGHYGYAFLLTEALKSGEIDAHRAYRLELSTGELTPVDMSHFRDEKVYTNSMAFYFTAAGNLLQLTESYDETVTGYLYDFTEKTWTEKFKAQGAIIQLASSKDEIALLKTSTNSDTYLTPPLMTVISLETLEVTEHELTYPGDSPFFCSIKQAISIAARDQLKDSGAGCLVSNKLHEDAIGYWLWDHISELPKLHLFEHGVVKYTSDNYGVAAIKPDGHVAYSAGRRYGEKDSNEVHIDIAEIIEVENEGIIEEQVASDTFIQSGKALDGAYSPFKMRDGTQFNLENPNVPGEIIAFFGHGSAVKNANGKWTSDRFMYNFPNSHAHTFHIGDNLILSEKNVDDPWNMPYWQLQLRKPPVNPEPEPEPNPEPEPQPEPTPES